MSDIVDRLDGAVDRLRGLVRWATPALVDNAIAEITRLRAEVERLRMTEAELDEVEEMIANYAAVADSNHERFRYSLEQDARRRAATLRGIAERHGRDAAPIV